MIDGEEVSFGAATLTLVSLLSAACEFLSPLQLGLVLLKVLHKWLIVRHAEVKGMIGGVVLSLRAATLTLEPGKARFGEGKRGGRLGGLDRAGRALRG
jgi:hypothetical protein